MTKKKPSVWMSCQRNSICWSSAANNRKTFTFVKFKLIEFPLILFYPFVHKVAIFAFSSAYSTITILQSRAANDVICAISSLYELFHVSHTYFFFAFNWFFSVVFRRIYIVWFVFFIYNSSFYGIRLCFFSLFLALDIVCKGSISLFLTKS